MPVQSPVFDTILLTAAVEAVAIASKINYQYNVNQSNLSKSTGATIIIGSYTYEVNMSQFYILEFEVAVLVLKNKKD